MLEVIVLGSGSRGNCTLFRCGGSAILVDAGFSAREIRRRLQMVGQEPGMIDAVLVTHEHSDHIGGIRVFAKRVPAVVCVNEATFRAAAGQFWDLPRMRTFVNGEPFGIGPFAVTPFAVPHDAADPVGFVIEAEGVRVGYATDLGHVTRLVEARLTECAALVFESNHDREMLMTGPYPWVTKQRVASSHGHLSNEHAAESLPLLVAKGAEHVVLAHISETNNDPRLAHAAATGSLREAGLTRVQVHVARQDEPSAALRF